MSDRTWLREVSTRDLSDIHHALRMIVKHPTVSGEESRLFTNLAAACWDEHVRRTEESRGRNPEDTSANERAEASTSDGR